MYLRRRLFFTLSARQQLLAQVFSRVPCEFVVIALAVLRTNNCVLSDNRTIRTESKMSLTVLMVDKLNVEYRISVTWVTLPDGRDSCTSRSKRFRVRQVYGKQ